MLPNVLTMVSTWALDNTLHRDLAQTPVSTRSQTTKRRILLSIPRLRDAAALASAHTASKHRANREIAARPRQ